LFTDREKEAGMDAGTETEKNLFHELCYHLLGTNQSEDVLCWRSLEHPQWLSGAEITSDGQVS
jgi:prolyl oligopeptidase